MKGLMQKVSKDHFWHADIFEILISMTCIMAMESTSEDREKIYK